MLMNTDLRIYFNSVVEVTHLTDNKCSAFMSEVNSCTVAKRKVANFVSRGTGKHNVCP